MPSFSVFLAFLLEFTITLLCCQEVHKKLLFDEL